MCRTRQQIANEDVLVSEVDDYLLERLSDSNGDKHWDILFGKMLQKTYVNSEYNEGQIRDLADSVETLVNKMDAYIDDQEEHNKKNPPLIQSLKEKTVTTLGTIFVVFGALFMFYYTALVVLGYAELLGALTP